MRIKEAWFSYSHGFKFKLSIVQISIGGNKKYNKYPTLLVKEGPNFVITEAEKEKQDEKKTSTHYDCLNLVSLG